MSRVKSQKSRVKRQESRVKPSYRSKKLSADSFDLVEVVFHTTHTQNATNIFIDLDYTMNHGGRRHTTAAIVPHLRPRCAQTLANRLCNNVT